MILLRCISFLIGSLIVTGAPFFLLPDAPQRPGEAATVLGACILVGLIASGFLLVGVAGNHMKRSRRIRTLGAILLAMPIVGGISVLVMDEAPSEMWVIGALLCFATFLFYGFVYPGKHGRSHRPLRPREQSALPSTVKA
jgi:Ca2+/Na+ antiporter